MRTVGSHNLNKCVNICCGLCFIMILFFPFHTAFYVDNGGSNEQPFYVEYGCRQAAGSLSVMSLKYVQSIGLAIQENEAAIQ